MQFTKFTNMHVCTSLLVDSVLVGDPLTKWVSG